MLRDEGPVYLENRWPGRRCHHSLPARQGARPAARGSSVGRGGGGVY